MKKTIEILSIGQRKKGISSKTNRPYDFTEFSILYDNSDNTHFGFTPGKMGEIVTIDQNLLEVHPLSPGDVVEVEMWSQFFKTKVGVIYG